MTAAGLIWTYFLSEKLSYAALIGLMPQGFLMPPELAHNLIDL